MVSLEPRDLECAARNRVVLSARSSVLIGLLRLNIHLYRLHGGHVTGELLTSQCQLKTPVLLFM